MIPDKTIETANRLGVPGTWLDALIRFESGYDPAAKNPSSSARGLIQLTDIAARDKPFSAADSASVIRKYSDFDSQMDNVVYPYLKKYMPYPTKQSLYMAVFYPAFRYYAVDREFPPAVQKANMTKTAQGWIVIRTPQDYADMVEGNRQAVLDRTREKGLPESGAAGKIGMIAVAAGAFLIYNYIRRGSL